jgi:hypothetical protein
LGHAAAELGAGHAQGIAQYPEQGHVGRDIGFNSLAIDIQLHDCLLFYMHFGSERRCGRDEKRRKKPPAPSVTVTVMAVGD